MRLQLLAATASLLLAAPAALRADAPICLLFQPTVASAPGQGAGVFGAAVLDRCGSMPGAATYALSNRHEVRDVLWFAEVQQGFGFQVASAANLSLRFFLGGTEQLATGRLHLNPFGAAWWGWDGAYDMVIVKGAHVITAATLDDIWDDPPAIDPRDPPLTALVTEFNGAVLQPGTGTDVVPEPATLTLLGTGLVGLAGASRRRKRREQLD